MSLWDVYARPGDGSAIPIVTRVQLSTAQQVADNCAEIYGDHSVFVDPVHPGSFYGATSPPRPAALVGP